MMGSFTILSAIIVLLPHCIFCRNIDDFNKSEYSKKDTLFYKKDWIKISRPPPARVTQSLGSPVELVCEISGSPVPTVQWIQGDVPLSEMESIEASSVSESNPTAIAKIRSVLVINNNLPTETTFTCLGRNGPNYQTASTVVHPEHETNSLTNLMFRNSHESHKPKIIFSYTQYMDLIGSSVILPCKATGHPRPETYWLNSAGEEIADKNGYMILPNGDLLISELKWDDMGSFMCIARNSVGKDIVNTFVYPAAKE